MSQSRLAVVVLTFSAALLAVLPGTAVPASAASPNSVTPSITLAPPTTTQLASQSSSYPWLGASVAFLTAYPNGTKNPSIRVNCYQNGVLVWGTLGATTDTYQLGGATSAWALNGGSATCTSDLISVVWKGGVETITTLASYGFVASA